jgi:hypothetical protein
MRLKDFIEKTVSLKKIKATVFASFVDADDSDGSKSWRADHRCLA